jgi:UDP-N-acetylmuramoyl-tripeptide--D-alanyl-D-alanine ligase
MKEFSITSLMQIIGAEVLPHTGWAAETAGDNALIKSVSIDSRTVGPGDCFFAIKGEKFDGHDYVADAFAKGAVCAVISKTVGGETLAGKCLLRVADTVKALGDFAGDYRRQAGFKVVGITGSVGKTTTRRITAHALSRRFGVHQSPSSFNNNIGVPLTLLGADPRDEIVVAELGSNHPGEISILTRIAQPDIAVVTNIHPAHLKGFGNIETIVREKTSISEGLGPDGVLIINGDFEQLIDACRPKGVELLTFGKSNGLDYRATDITSDGLSSRFMIDQTEVTLPLPGPGNIENALAAWAVCSRLGLKIEEFAEAVRALPPVSMRAEVLQIGTLTVLNDCYNANPASMENALGILQNLQANTARRSVFICGDMAELGDEDCFLHGRLGASIAEAGVGLLIAVGEYASIVEDCAAGPGIEVHCFGDVGSACNNLHEFIKEYDIVLVKGSRCARLETAVEKLKELFA